MAIAPERLPSREVICRLHRSFGYRTMLLCGLLNRIQHTYVAFALNIGTSPGSGLFSKADFGCRISAAFGPAHMIAQSFYKPLVVLHDIVPLFLPGGSGADVRQNIDGFTSFQESDRQM